LAEPKTAAYLADVKKPAWIKIKNPAYSQKEADRNCSSGSFGASAKAVVPVRCRSD